MERAKPRMGDDSGIALVVTVLVLGLLLMLGSAFLTISSTETQIAHNQLDAVQALYIADGGVQVALHQIKVNTAANPAYYASLDTLVGGSAAFGAGDYTYSLRNVGPGPAGNPVIEVTSIGAVGAAGSTIKARVQAAYKSQFGDAAHAQGKIKLDGGSEGNVRTDSYNSISSPDASVCVGGECPGTKGGISTDATSKGVMELKGHVWVGGDALVGPGAPATAMKQGENVTIHGETGTEAGALAMPCLALPPGVSSSGNFETEAVGPHDWGTAGTITTLVYDQVKIKASASVRIEGKVILYVLGEFRLEESATVNTGGLPSHLELRFVGDETGPFRVKNDSVFSGVVYGCNLNIEVEDNAAIFGSLVGKKVKLRGNARVHYDEALAPRLDIFIGYRLTAWQEVIPQ